MNDRAKKRFSSQSAPRHKEFSASAQGPDRRIQQRISFQISSPSEDLSFSLQKYDQQEHGNLFSQPQAPPEELGVSPHQHQRHTQLNLSIPEQVSEEELSVPLQEVHHHKHEKLPSQTKIRPQKENVYPQESKQTSKPEKHLQYEDTKSFPWKQEESKELSSDLHKHEKNTEATCSHTDNRNTQSTSFTDAKLSDIKLTDTESEFHQSYSQARQFSLHRQEWDTDLNPSVCCQNTETTFSPKNDEDTIKENMSTGESQDAYLKKSTYTGRDRDSTHSRDTDQDSYSELRKMEWSMCAIHMDKVEELYCVCHHEMVCILCAATTHRHCQDMKTLQNQDRRRQHLQQLATTLRRRETVVADERKEVEKELEDLSRRLAESTDDLHQAADGQRTTDKDTQMSLDPDKPLINAFSSPDQTQDQLSPRPSDETRNSQSGEQRSTDGPSIHDSSYLISQSTDEQPSGSTDPQTVDQKTTGGSSSSGGSVREDVIHNRPSSQDSVETSKTLPGGGRRRSSVAEPPHDSLTLQTLPSASATSNSKQASKASLELHIPVLQTASAASPQDSITVVTLSTFSLSSTSVSSPPNISVDYSHYKLHSPDSQNKSAESASETPVGHSKPHNNTLRKTPVHSTPEAAIRRPKLRNPASLTTSDTARETAVSHLQQKGPTLARTLKVGDRVKRSREWMSQDMSGHGLGTVTAVPSNMATRGGYPGGLVDVRWDAGGEGCYRMGRYNHYDLDLA